MRKKLFAIVAALALALPLWGNDILVPASSRYVVLGRGLAWSGTGFGAMGNNFIFAPQDPDQGICVFIVNNDTNLHTWTLTTKQTGDPTASGPTSQPSRWSTINNFGNPGTVAGSTQAQFFVRSQAAARVSIGFSSIGGATGTADLFAVQTASPLGCSSAALAVQGAEGVGATPTANPLVIGGINSGGTIARYGIGSASGAGTGFPNTTTTTGIFNALRLGSQTYNSGDGGIGLNLVQSYVNCGIARLCVDQDVNKQFQSAGAMTGNSGAWVAQNSVINPTLNQDLLHFVQLGSGSGSAAFFKNAIIDCSAACDIQIFQITTKGTTCTAATNVTNPYLNATLAYAGNFSGSNGEIAFTCATNPTPLGHLLFEITLNATTPYTLDLSGFICNIVVSQPCGIMIRAGAAFTGTFSTSVEWAE